MRLFVALPFPQAIQTQIGNYCAQLEPAFRHARPNWVAPENLHLTLHFYGELDEKRAEQLQDRLAAACKLCPSLTLATTKLAVLPSVRTPRVLYIDLKIEPLERLLAFVEQLRAIAQDLGAENDSRPWTAHLTLARLKVPSIPELSTLPKPPHVQFSLDSFDLIQARLGRTGAVYTVMRHYHFGTSTL